MKIEISPDAGAVARKAADTIALDARAAVSARGRYVLAVSGGTTPWMMLAALAEKDLPWNEIHWVQVDERVAPDGHPDRNLTRLQECLLRKAPIAPDHLHAMPVGSSDLKAAAARYAETLVRLAGAPPVLDLVHLGLGADGHTASLVPGDPALDIADVDVSVTDFYQGRRRMTLTFPILNRARRILWIVTGREKADMLARLREGDESIPAGRLRRDRALILADRAAGAGVKDSDPLA